MEFTRRDVIKTTAGVSAGLMAPGLFVRSAARPGALLQAGGRRKPAPPALVALRQGR